MKRLSYLKVDSLIIGGGIIGVAVARELALTDRINDLQETICLVEREKHLGQHTTSRNSEVIHAGIYYKPNSLKATLCVRGRRLLYQYAQENNIPHRRIEKLIVSTAGQDLQPIYERGLENDVEGLSLLSTRETRLLEPEITPCESLYSTQTGIINSHAYLRSLARDFKRAGGDILLNTPVTGLERTGDNEYLVTLGGADPVQLLSSTVINCSGLWSPWILSWVPPTHHHFQPSYAEGRYFSLRRPPPVQRLIYPTPEVGGLGIHLTWELSGRAKLGPDVQWVNGPSSVNDSIDYGWDDPKGDLQRVFYQRAREYLPMLHYDDLIPDQLGLRGKSAPQGSYSDFLIIGGSQDGLPGLIHLVGIESPGLTASLAIAEVVIDRLRS